MNLAEEIRALRLEMEETLAKGYVVTLANKGQEIPTPPVFAVKTAVRYWGKLHPLREKVKTPEERAELKEFALALMNAINVEPGNLPDLDDAHDSC